MAAKLSEQTVIEQLFLSDKLEVWHKLTRQRLQPGRWRCDDQVLPHRFGHTLQHQPDLSVQSLSHQYSRQRHHLYDTVVFPVISVRYKGCEIVKFLLNKLWCNMINCCWESGAFIAKTCLILV